MNERELATVLAALRYWQNDLDDPSLTTGFDEHFADVPRLDADEIDQLCQRLNNEVKFAADEIVLSWYVEDVLSVRENLSREQACEVLQHVKQNHDATFGVTWDTLEYWADELYPSADDTDDEDKMDATDSDQTDFQVSADPPTNNPIPALIDALELAQAQFEQLTSLHEGDGEFLQARDAVNAALAQV